MSNDLLFLSGGGTKFVGHVAATKTIIQSYGYKPNKIIGVSAGALASVPVAMGLFDEIKEIGLNLEVCDFFDDPPIKDNGNIRIENIAKAILLGLNYIGKQNVAKVIENVITEEIFDKYKKGDYAECISMTVNLDNGEKVFRNIKNATYEEYKTYMAESSAIPIMTQEVNGKFVDGGIFDHNPCFSYLEKYDDELVDNVISVYTRPENPVLKKRNWTKNLITTFARVFEAFIMETSVADEKASKYLCQAKDINLIQTFMPSIMDGFYDVDKDKLYCLYKETLEMTKIKLNI